MKKFKINLSGVSGNIFIFGDKVEFTKEYVLVIKDDKIKASFSRYFFISVIEL